MYWTHLIFALIISLLQCRESLTSIKPGYLDFDNLPETNFSCKNKVIGGYYADVETGCQMFHVCTIGQKGEVTDIKFLCLNGTVFDQETRVCERIDEVDCSKSEDFFNLNLELYGNHAGGIQPEEEFFCEDCSTEEDDYDLSSEVTTRPSSTSTSSTTTTTTARTTTTTTTPTTTTSQPSTRASVSPNKVHYTNSDSETIAALLALHNAFSHSVQNQPQQGSKVKPPPPRVINNAFASVAPSTAKPSAFYPRPQVTQLPPRIENTYDDDDRQSHHHHRDQNRHYAHGTLQVPSNFKERHKTNYYQATTPSNLDSNFHHFQSGDGGFVHSFEPGKQYNYQYYQPRNLPEESKAKASISIVTSTSTSTSVRASKPNVTVQEDFTGPEDEFPTAYEDYPDDAVDEAFFRDVPKLRTKRSQDSSEPRYSNHKYPDESENATTSRHLNHRYEETTTIPPFLPKEEFPSTREEFLQNLLGSLDMEEHDRQKMVQLFKSEEQEMKQPSSSLKQLGNKLGELIMDDINKTIHLAKMEEKNSTGDVLDLEKIDQLWRNHYAEMSQEVDLKFDLGVDRDRRNADKNEELSKALAQDYELASNIQNYNLMPEYIKSAEQTGSREKRQAIGLDTEQFTANHERRGRVRERPAARQYSSTPRTNTESIKDVVPVFEDVDEGDFTTRPYLKIMARTQGPRLTTRSVDNTQSRVRFNYEITTPETVVIRRRKLSGRTATIRQPALVQPPVLNLTRDVSKLKDTPVYEENGDSKEFENEQFPHRQPSLLNQNAEERSYERFDTSSPSTVINISSEPATTQATIQSTRRSSGRSRRPVSRGRQSNRSEGEQRSGPTRVVHRSRVSPNPNSNPQNQSPTQRSHSLSTHHTVSPIEATQPQRELKGRDDYQTEEPVQLRTVEAPKPKKTYRGSARGTFWSTTPPNEPPPAPPLSPDLVQDPNFDCEGKIKGGFYADLSNDCKGFFICSQGAINGPLLKTHFWCGTSTKFNQRSRTCQAEDLVECSVSERYFHLNQDFAIPETEEQLRPAFEPKRVQG